MLKLEDIDRVIRDVQKRMIRFIETGDLRRLARLKERLAKLQADLDILKASKTPPWFRRSYVIECNRNSMAINSMAILCICRDDISGQPGDEAGFLQDR